MSPAAICASTFVACLIGSFIPSAKSVLYGAGGGVLVPWFIKTV